MDEDTTMPNEEHEKIIRQEPSIVELLAMPEAADIDFEPPRLSVIILPPNL